MKNGSHMHGVDQEYGTGKKKKEKKEENKAQKGT